MFGVLSCNFIAAHHPFRKRVSRCIQSTSFCHRNHFFVFRNEHAQSTNLGPKLIFGLISRNFVAARHPFRKRVSGDTKHEFLPPEPFLHFSQRTCPLHYFRSKTHVWVVFAQFRCSTSPIPKTGIGCIQTQFLRPEPFLRFSQRTCPIYYFRSKTHVWDRFAQFRCRTSPIPMFGIVSHNFIAARHPFRKRVSGCIQSTSFCYRNLFFVFRHEHAQSTTLGPKLMFGVVSRNFVAARHPFRKRVSWSIQSMKF
jgi:hypothetical protein